MCCSCNCNNNFGIQNNFNGGFGDPLDGLGFSSFGDSYDNNRDEIDKLAPEQRAERKKKLAKIAKRFGTDTIAGHISNAAIDYRRLRITFNVKTIADKDGSKIIDVKEGFISAANKSELNTLWVDMYSDRIVVIDSSTGELVGSVWGLQWA